MPHTNHGRGLFFSLREWVKHQLLFPMLLTLEKGIARLSLVGDPAVFDNSVFPWTARLEENWEKIRAELEDLLPHLDELPALQDIQQEQQAITTDQQWKTFFLLGYGRWARLNAARCPETTRLLEEVPNLLTAFFSILGPNKHIPRHRGVFKGMIRSHLGLIVPGRPCATRMTVGPKQVCWQEGKMIVFDNTYHHEVWNDTNQIRVVLLIDVVRPFPWPVSWLNGIIIKLIGWSSYVQDAARKHDAWEKAFNASLGEDNSPGRGEHPTN